MPTPRKAGRSATKVRTSVVTQVATVVLFAAAGAAAAAFATIKLLPPPALTVSVAPSAGVSEQSTGSKFAKALDLRFTGGPKPVMVSGLALAFYGDTDGDFSNGIADDLPSVKVVGDCELRNGQKTLAASQVDQNTKTLAFAFALPLVARQSETLGVFCNVGMVLDGTPDIFALGLPNTSAVSFRAAIISMAGKPVTSGVSFGSSSSLNMKGKTAVRIHPDTVCGTDADGDRYPLISSPMKALSWPATCPPGLTELRADGAQDCNDSSATVHPGAAETCNRVDDNCNAQVDEVLNCAAAQLPASTNTPTITLASWSPSGAGYQQDRGEVFRFNVTAPSSDDVVLDQVEFRLTSTDNAGTKWNTPGQFSYGSFWLYDAADPSLAIPAGLWLHNATGGVANLTDEIRYVDFFVQSIEIPAGQTKSFILKMDTSGAHVGDYVRVDIPAESVSQALTPPQHSIEWHNPGHAPAFGTNLRSLPVTGGTIVF